MSFQDCVRDDIEQTNLYGSNKGDYWNWTCLQDYKYSFKKVYKEIRNTETYFDLNWFSIKYIFALWLYVFIELQQFLIYKIQTHSATSFIFQMHLFR